VERRGRSRGWGRTLDVLAVGEVLLLDVEHERRGGLGRPVADAQLHLGATAVQGHHLQTGQVVPEGHKGQWRGGRGASACLMRRSDERRS